MPKLYITGNGPDGRSRIVETHDITGQASPLSPYASETPVPVLPKSGSDAKLLASHSAPGSYRTVLFPWKPGMHTEPHRTTSVDVNVVLEGSLILGVEEGEVTLHKGDVVVLPGTVHTWRATHEPALVLYTIQSSEPTAEDRALPTTEPMEIIHGR